VHLGWARGFIFSLAWISWVPRGGRQIRYKGGPEKTLDSDEG
jgi:hypothetical protein